MKYNLRMATLLCCLLLVTGWAIKVYAGTSVLLAVGGGSGVTPTPVLSADHTGTAVTSATLTAGTGTLNLTGATAVNVSGPLKATDDNISVDTAGKGLKIKEGSNARMGQSTLVAGVVTNANTSVISANTRVFLSRATTGGVEGTLSCVVSNATWFIINSSTNADTSAVNWILFEKQ